MKFISTGRKGKMSKLMVYIPTLGREGKQITLNSIPQRWADRVFLVCPKEEKHEWKNRIDVPSECIGSISKTRQFIIENSPSKFVGMMDDDLFFYKRDSINKTLTHRLNDIGEILDLMESWLIDGDVFCSLSPTFMLHLNPSEYYYGKPAHSAFLNRDYLKDNNIRYDEMTYFEDFHVPLSVLESGKRLRNTGEFIAKEKKANAPGGCSLTRTAERNRQAMIDLQSKHPKYIKLTEDPNAINQNLVVGLKMRIMFKKAYDDNVMKGETIENFFD